MIYAIIATACFTLLAFVLFELASIIFQRWREHNPIARVIDSGVDDEGRFWLRAEILDKRAFIRAKKRGCNGISFGGVVRPD